MKGRFGTVAIGLAAVLFSGCASPFDESPRALVAEDFVGRAPGGTPVPDRPTGATSGLPSNQAGDTVSAEAMTRVWEPIAGLSRGQGFSPDLGPRGAMALTVKAGKPDLPSQQPRNEPIKREYGRLVDAKVGEVHGEPIFVSTFFDEAFLARVRADAPQDRAQWRNHVRLAIASKLRDVITNILLRESARSQLSESQQVGLFAVLRRYQDNLLSSSAGNRVAAENRLRRSYGLTWEEAVKLQEERVLVERELALINRTAIVPSAEIERSYERMNREENTFTPDPVLVLRLIRARKENTDGVAEIEQKLANGEPFEEIAQLNANVYRRAEGGLQRAENAGALTEAKPFAAVLEPVNEVVRTMTLGQWEGPIEVDGYLHWVLLERIEDNSMSLYEAQYYLANKLRLERMSENQRRHIEKLKMDVNFEEEQAMIDRLVIAAEEIFFPSN
ncbi:MAG: hypothetical protein H6815_13885 [Phycisphaeraceae bacterium]|nr:hypothetical protein [Phycisphaerales bacterium]MCB9861530.1 hypothetical protein [Phycisphaeraceae bacterium]